MEKQQQECFPSPVSLRLVVEKVYLSQRWIHHPPNKVGLKKPPPPEGDKPPASEDPAKVKEFLDSGKGEKEASQAKAKAAEEVALKKKEAEKPKKPETLEEKWSAPGGPAYRPSLPPPRKTKPRIPPPTPEQAAKAEESKSLGEKILDVILWPPRALLSLFGRQYVKDT